MGFNLPEQSVFTIDELSERWNKSRDYICDLVFEQGLLRPATKLSDFGFRKVKFECVSHYLYTFQEERLIPKYMRGLFKPSDISSFKLVADTNGSGRTYTDDWVYWRFVKKRSHEALLMKSNMLVCFAQFFGDNCEVTTCGESTGDYYKNNCYTACCESLSGEKSIYFSGRPHSEAPDIELQDGRLKTYIFWFNKSEHLFFRKEEVTRIERDIPISEISTVSAIAVAKKECERKSKQSWKPKKPQRFTTYIEPLFELIQRRYQEGKQPPTPAEVCDEWRQRPPAGYGIEVHSFRVEFSYRSNGVESRKTVDHENLAKRIKNLYTVT